ncbi:MAG: hypothetical protein MUO26_04855 [Methanotrichaceae archaeon]|nr:hypothetical protein [Methanotrichaceae archaeon]
MRLSTILFAIILLVYPVLAVHESVELGYYRVYFDMNTTANYKLMTEEPSSSDVTHTGQPFERFNLTIDGDEGFAFIILTDYNQSMVADINANMEIVQDVMEAIGCERPSVFQPVIDGQPGVLGSCRFPSGDLLVSASYSPDGKQQEDRYLGKTNLRVLSTFPWEITRDMLNSLDVKAR